MTSSSQPPDLDRYLARHRFRPHASHSTWLDRDNGQHVIRVVREPEEHTQLIFLTPRSGCVYQAAFSLGTPDAVIIAAVQAALREELAPASGSAGSARLMTGSPGPSGRWTVARACMARATVPPLYPAFVRPGHWAAFTRGSARGVKSARGRGAADTACGGPGADRGPA
jgi:hypothetical protein